MEVYKDYPEYGCSGNIREHDGRMLVQVYPSDSRKRMQQAFADTLQDARFLLRRLACAS